MLLKSDTESSIHGVETIMKEAKLPIAEIAVIGATRGMLGIGLGLLLADRLLPSRRREFALPLLLIGALTTIPLVMDVVRRSGTPETTGKRKAAQS